MEVVSFRPELANEVVALIVAIQRDEFAIEITAERLLEVLLAWARERKIREVFLGTTAKFLAAHRFYEKNGFAEITPAALPPAFPVMPVDVKFYQRRLA